MAVSEQYKVIWKNIDTVRLNTERIKEEKPEIYRDFSNATSQRRLIIKAA